MHKCCPAFNGRRLPHLLVNGVGRCQEYRQAQELLHVAANTKMRILVYMIGTSQRSNNRAACDDKARTFGMSEDSAVLLGHKIQQPALR